MGTSAVLQGHGELRFAINATGALKSAQSPVITVLVFFTSLTITIFANTNEASFPPIY